MLGKHVIFPFSSINYMFSVNYIFLLNITYIFAIIRCLGFLVKDRAQMVKWLSEGVIFAGCWRLNKPLQQYSIANIVFLYLPTTCWHIPLFSVSEWRKWKMIDILQNIKVTVMVFAHLLHELPLVIGWKRSCPRKNIFSIMVGNNWHTISYNLSASLHIEQSQGFHTVSCLVGCYPKEMQW